jgi:hypothetical protein
MHRQLEDTPSVVMSQIPDHQPCDPYYIRSCTVTYACAVSEQCTHHLSLNADHRNDDEEGRTLLQLLFYVDFLNYGTLMYYGRHQFEALKPMMRSQLPECCRLLSFRFEPGQIAEFDMSKRFVVVPENHAYFGVYAKTW